SCAYNSVFPILYAVWKTNPVYWSHNFGSINNDILEGMCNGFHSHSNGLTSLEHVRDIFRHELDDLQIAGLQWGRPTSVVRLLQLMFTTPTQIVSSQLTCSQEHSLTQAQTHQHSIQSCVLSAGANPYASIQGLIQNYHEDSKFRCSEYNQHLIHLYSFLSVPAIIIFEFEEMFLRIDPEVTIVSRHTQHFTIRLKGIIYHGEAHYTSHIILNQQLWLHDGITAGANMIYERLLHSTTDLMHCRGKEATVAIYA
ncbi:hypothetical protein L208DRAFT_1333799, partial [Tricholoma matsutake]